MDCLVCWIVFCGGVAKEQLKENRHAMRRDKSVMQMNDMKTLRHPRSINDGPTMEPLFMEKVGEMIFGKRRVRPVA